MRCAIGASSSRTLWLAERRVEVAVDNRGRWGGGWDHEKDAFPTSWIRRAKRRRLLRRSIHRERSPGGGRRWSKKTPSPNNDNKRGRTRVKSFRSSAAAERHE